MMRNTSEFRDQAVDPDTTEVPAMPRPVIPLGYASAPGPWRRNLPLAAQWTVAVLRRLLFATGVGLAMGGLTAALNHGGLTDDASEAAGVGAAFVALVVPFPGLSRWRLQKSSDGL